MLIEAPAGTRMRQEQRLPEATGFNHNLLQTGKYYFQLKKCMASPPFPPPAALEHMDSITSNIFRNTSLFLKRCRPLFLVQDHPLRTRLGPIEEEHSLAQVCDSKLVGFHSTFSLFWGPTNEIVSFPPKKRENEHVRLSTFLIFRRIFYFKDNDALLFLLYLQDQPSRQHSALGERFGAHGNAEGTSFRFNLSP